MHIPSLLQTLHALFYAASAEPGVSIGHNGWPDGSPIFKFNGETAFLAGRQVNPISIYTAAFHAFMVFDIAAYLKNRRGVFNYEPTKFYRAAMQMAAHCFTSITLPALQGVLLLTIHSLVTPADMNIWTLTHICMAHCLDLGLHRESELNSTSLTATVLRRLVFSSVYHLDR